MHNVVNTPEPSFLIGSSFIFAGNEGSQEVSNEFEIRADTTMDCRVSCPWTAEKISIELQLEKML